jgi:hypothetical protein
LKRKIFDYLEKENFDSLKREIFDTINVGHTVLISALIKSILDPYPSSHSAKKPTTPPQKKCDRK